MRDSDGGVAEADEGQHRGKIDATLYRSIVGGLRYLVHTRSDIAFAVGYVSRFMEDPREDHWAAVKRLLRYVKVTVDQVIVFPKTGASGLQLTVFSDADMAGDIDGRRSTSDVLVFLGSAPISCLSLRRWWRCPRARQSTWRRPQRRAMLCGCAGCWAS